MTVTDSVTPKAAAKRQLLFNKPTSAPRCDKSFYIRNLSMFVISWSVFTAGPFQPRQGQDKGPESCFTWVGSGFTHIRLGSEGLPGTNTQDYYKYSSITGVKALQHWDQMKVL
jgi:hypothetical protein